MPQYAIERLYALTKDRDLYITTEVGQHQMWAAQFFDFEEPNRWMTSGGLGTMGYGLPAAIGVQMAHPKSLVIDIAGDASILMNIQEMSTAVQFRLPVKIFILNNQYMGMVRQWQQLLHGNRLSESYTEAMPDFVKLAEAYGGVGIRCDKPEDLDDAIMAMLNAPADRPVLFDCRVAALANCFPMIPSGKAHQRDAAGRRRHGRGDRQGHQQGRQGAGVELRSPRAHGERRTCAIALRITENEAHAQHPARLPPTSSRNARRRPSRIPSRWWSTTSRACWRASSACSRAAATTSRA